MFYQSFSPKHGLQNLFLFSIFATITLFGCVKHKDVTIYKFCKAPTIEPSWYTAIMAGRPAKTYLIEKEQFSFLSESREEEQLWSTRVAFCEKRGRRRLSKEISTFVSKELSALVNEKGSAKMKQIYTSNVKRRTLNSYVLSIVLSHSRATKSWYDCQNMTMFSEIVLDMKKVNEDLFQTMKKYRYQIDFDISDSALQGYVNEFTDAVLSQLRNENTSKKLTTRAFYKNYNKAKSA